VGTDSTQGTLNATAQQAVENAGGLKNLEIYWNLQNAYLNRLFPFSSTVASANPSTGTSATGHRRLANTLLDGEVPHKR
jgi:hypothetical protein